MRPDAFERDIRKVLDEVEYRPSEESWQKMQKTLLEGKDAGFVTGLGIHTTKKKPFWSMSRAVAAACIGVFATGAVLFYVNDNKIAAPGRQLAREINSLAAPKPLAEQINTKADQQQNVLQPSNSSIAQVQNRSFSASDLGLGTDVEHPLISQVGFAANTLNHVQSGSISAAMEMRMASNTVNVATQRNERFKIAEDMGSKLYSAFDWSDNPEHAATFEDPFIYGISVKGGLPKVGLIQFNAGMTVKRDWSKKMYTEANLDVSYTDVRYQKALYYRRNDNGSFTNLGNNFDNAAMAASVSGSTTNTYGNHVIGVGLAVIAGYNVTKNLSVAAGADMYRNFNNKLILEDDNPFVKGTTLKNTVTPLKWINVWDAGARAQLRYRVSDYVSLVAQYRHGLVNYMSDEVGKKIKNSSVGLGVNISLNP